MANEGVSEGVNKECADQGDVFKDGEHLMGNIEFARKKIPQIFMKMT